MIKDGKMTSLGLSFETDGKLNIMCKEFELTRSQIIKLLIDMMDEIYTVSKTDLSKNEPLKIQSDGYGITLSTENIALLSESVQKATNKLKHGIIIIPPRTKKKLRLSRKRANNNKKKL